MKLIEKGFTLIELVIVIIILAVLGIATSTYISTGVDIYSGVAERDKELNSNRFVMERLRRDILNALPNSLTVSDIGNKSNQCLTFTPIIKSSIYTYDFPIFPITKITASIASIDDYSFSSGDEAAVYVLNPTELSSDKVHTISKIEDDKITFTQMVSFPLSSPSKRVYIIRGTKSYYFNSADELILANSCTSTGNTMATDIRGTFEVLDPTLQRNGLAKVTFILDFDGQTTPIEQTLQVNNVP